jgi:transmembrane sensor
LSSYYEMKSNNPEHIDEHLLLQYLLGNLNDEERRSIEAWLHRSEENRKSLERMEALWLETGKIIPAPVAVHTDAAWKKLSEKIDMEEGIAGKEATAGKASKIRLNWHVAGIAAAVLLLIGFYFLFKDILPSGKQMVVESNNRITPDTLEDGSVIILNKRSKLTYPERFSPELREVVLSGEASCTIVHDPERPFIIDCGRGKIRVIGTGFHVRAYPGQEITITVKEGLVLFFSLEANTGDTNGILLSGGMRGVLRIGSTLPERLLSASQDELPGTGKKFEFINTPLREVLDDLSRTFQTEIRVSDSSICQCRLTASFEGEPVEQVLRVIAATFDLELTKNNETYLLTGNGCKGKKK